MLSRPMYVSCGKQLMKGSDDGGEMWILLITCLMAGMRGHCVCGVLSRSRRLVASSPLRAKTERATMRGPMQ